MNSMLAGMVGGWQIVLIVACVLLLFGAKKIPEFAKGLGQSVKEFKKASRDEADGVQNSTDDKTGAKDNVAQSSSSPKV
jgi:sec-independent protein translocase protein TatA